MKVKRIGVVMGGTSAEREISLRSGRSVAHALEQSGYDVVRLELSSSRQSLRMLSEARLDAAFLALHGRLGEDGCVQGLLELLEIPYTGSSVLGSALAMDKLKAKELFRLHNVPTPGYYVYEGDGTRDAILSCHNGFGFPVMVKPRREGSSLGLQKVNDAAELVSAMRIAQGLDSSVLVERFVAGKELTVGILDGQPLGCLEVAPSEGIFDYQAKYQSQQTQYFIPPRLPDAVCRGAMQLALRAAKALGVSGAARVDLIASEEQNEYVLEVNTLPGMTPTSLLPKIAAAAGYSFAQLCQAIVQCARLHVSQTRHVKEAAVLPLTHFTSERRLGDRRVASGR
jgi:D-alanine-D-alanine ligase